MSKLICGVGFNDNQYPAWVNGRATKEYRLWRAMLQRCYDAKYHDKYPTYAGCLVSDNFKSYSYFYNWCHNQIGFGLDGWHLDKDILIRNNKIYSEDACVFVPSDVNNFFVDCRASRGLYPVGVNFDKATGKYRAQCTVKSNGRKYLGLYPTPDSAHSAYKACKEALCKDVADYWRGQIDKRVYNVLMSWKLLSN